MKKFSPAAAAELTETEIQGYVECQRLAQKAVKEIAGLLREGWTEDQAAKLLNAYLRDSGVQGFFHHSFVWFGERTRFDGVKNYAEYSPSKRVLLPNEVFILDVAPIFKGFICDIGYTGCLGENVEYDKAMELLKALRAEIPTLFQTAATGGEVWQTIHERLESAGYENIHAKYPFSVLGHRVHRVPEQFPAFKLLNFGWQSYWSFVSRGLFGQLLNQNFEGSLDGLWAVEPHLGAKHFGAKFEEILVVSGGRAKWLDKLSW